jgi:hypothetical protein
MAKQLSELDNYCLQQLQAGAEAPTPPAPARDPAVTSPTFKFRRRDGAVPGMQVREERLSSITAQRMYKMRCECGRSWFELECPKIVHCPACHQAGLVST